MDKRKKLLELIEKNNIPLPPDEAEEHVSKLSDDEVELLLSTYEGLGNAEDVVEEVISELEPKEYKKVKREYEDKLKLDKEDYEKELEKSDGNFDSELDKIEDEAVAGAENAVKEMNEEIKGVEKAREEIVKLSKSSLQ